MDKWFDVQDEEGVWRVGECLYQDAKGMKNIAIDGFSPSFNALYCQHSAKIMPIRTQTKGLTSPPKPLREVLTQTEIQNVSTRLQLLLMKPNLLQLEGKYIRQLIRTELLILTHKIFTTPYEIIKEVRMMDLNINKLFINLLSFYLRLLDFSKVSLTLIDNNPNARQLYQALYELTDIVTLIVGIHPDSQKLFTNKLNLSLTTQGFIDCLIKSDGGLLPIRHFLKSASNNIKIPNVADDYCISLKIISLFLELCEKAKNDLVSVDQTKTMLILDEVISHLRGWADKQPEIKTELSNNHALLNKIQALFYQLKPNKTCTLRKSLKSEQAALESQTLSDKVIPEQTVSSGQIKKLEERMQKLQAMLASATIKSAQKIGSNNIAPVQFQRPKVPVQNLGQEMFLGSVQWALQNGDVETAKKLVKWRKSLLQVGRITGWEVALAIGCRTFQKGEITAADIIGANYEYISKQTGK